MFFLSIAKCDINIKNCLTDIHCMPSFNFRWLEEKIPLWLGVPVRGALLPVGTVAVKSAISNIFGIRHGGYEQLLGFTTESIVLLFHHLINMVNVV